ncbi:14712_t:CDS:1, partial [Entrophospora sp. SA101]
MMQIQSVQTEYDRLEPLVSEFIQKNTIHKGERAKVQQRDILWSVVDELTKAFNLSDPTEHEFFKNTKEMNDNGFNNMFTCYEKGLKHLNELLYQEVYKTLPRSTVGRRSKDVAFVKVKEHNELVKEINKKRQNDEAEIRDNIPVLVEDITIAPVDEILQVETTSHKRHKKTDKELEILQEVFSHLSSLDDD